ncbi:MAG: OsmC family protein [Bacteroidota bacterium]
MQKREAIIRHVQNLTFIGKAGSNHWTTMDSSHGESSAAATSPMELILLALGGCTGSDVAIILEKKRARVSKFEMKITGERAAEDPKVYTSIHITYIFEGFNLREKDIVHAIELSMTKYCSVSAMLKKSVALTYSYSIVGSGGAA